MAHINQLKSVITHNMTYTRLYRIWRSMKYRCNSPHPSNKNYHYKGIRVCDEWNNSFKSFYKWSMSNGYKDDLSIDRINNKKGYNSDNCRWVNYNTQIANQNLTSKNTSGYTGVRKDDRGYWVANINFKGKRIFFKRSKYLKKCLIERDKFIIKNNLPHRLNLLKQAGEER